MNLGEYLRHKEIDFSAILASAQETIGFEPADVLLAVGSLVEGLGNRKSDLDLLLITIRPTAAREIALVVGKCLMDVQLLHPDELEKLISRFEAWAKLPWQVTHAMDFSPEERRLIHRLLHCEVLHGQEHWTARKLPSREDLARLKLHVARQWSRTIQVDLVGSYELGDYPTLVLAAQDLLGHAADALVAGYYFTNPTSKWRIRILADLPPDWEYCLNIRPTGTTATQRFWQLHRAPEQPEKRPALEHSFRIATFSRAVFRWAERRLLQGTTEPAILGNWPRKEAAMKDIALPYLDLDVDFCDQDGRIGVARLNEFDDPIWLSAREFAVALLFDGATTAGEADAVLCESRSDKCESGFAIQVVSRLQQAGLCVRLEEM
jgi:hypothetical protein